MTPGDLLDAARDLAFEGVPPRPEAHLRRAVSTAYYAVFHCLAGAAADAFVGSAQAAHPAWSRVYRALDHGSAKSRCKDKGALLRFGFPSGLRAFAETFVYLQDRRHLADYKPRLDDREVDEHFGASVVAADIAEAERAIGTMARATAPDRRAFAAYLLFPERR